MVAQDHSPRFDVFFDVARVASRLLARAVQRRATVLPELGQMIKHLRLVAVLRHAFPAQHQAPVSHDVITQVLALRTCRAC